MEYFKRSEEKNIVTLPFNKIFKQNISFLNNFHLHKKRTYCNIMDTIIKYDNELLRYNKNNEFLFDYLLIKFRIDARIYISEEEFISDMYDILFRKNKNLYNAISDYTEKNYQFCLDDNLTNNFNEGLQFTDGHCKILHMISLGMKYLIPLILEFAYLNPSVHDDIGEFLLVSFDPLFDIFSQEVDILNKLYESVHSRITGTRYSDRVYWYYAEVMGYSIEFLTNNLIKKLIIDIIPKYEFEKNIISLNHVFINNNIEYTFRINFPINFKPLNLTEGENNGLTDFDKLSINTARINESEIAINRVNISTTINYLLKKYKIVISNDEIKYYINNFSLNKLQKNFLFLFFAKDFGSAISPYNCNLREYVILLIIMKRILEKNNFIYLQNIITAKTINLKEKNLLTAKQFQKIIEGEKYNNVLNSKFLNTFTNIIESHTIEKILSTIINNKFIIYDYNNQENEGTELKINQKMIAEEILRFIEMI